MSERITINLTEPKEEITFTLTDQKEEVVFSFSEAARGPQGEPGSPLTVDQTIIDGSTNAVSGNAVFDGLALKAPIANPTFTGIVTAPRITGRCDGLEVFCKAGLAISAGQVVYVTGASGNNIIIGLAQANAELTSSKTIGISESTLANNATGYVITEGLMTVSISAPTAVEGDPIWLSPTTAGGMVFGAANKPVAPNHMVYLGVVTRKTGNTVVEIFVKVQNGSELEELADVSITSPTAGQALMRGASLWENRSLVAADISDSTTAGRSLITAADAAAQRTALGLGTAATTNTGTGATNTILGNDARLTDARTPLSHTHGNITNDGKIGTTATMPIITTTGGTLTTGSFGTTAGTFTQGDDSRLTDERVPTAAGIASKINGATAKTTLVDADETVLTDSAASFGLKKVTWANVFAYILTKIQAAASIVFTGQLRSTNQTAATADALMTRSLSDTRFGERISIVVGADQTLASSTTYTDVTSTETTLSAGTWHIRSSYMISMASTAPGVKARILISGTAIEATGKTYISGFSSFTSLSTQSPLIGTVTVLANIAEAGNTFRNVEWEGIIILPTERTLKMQFAQNTSSADLITFLKGSHYIARKL